jgi:hypothetical protein
MREILDPEDVYGEVTGCYECGIEWYSGQGTECPECGYDPADDYDPPEPDYDDYDPGWPMA